MARYATEAQELYNYMTQYMLRHNHPATRAELQRFANVSKTTIEAWLGYLMGKKLVKKAGHGVYLVDGIEYTDKRQWITKKGND